MKSYRDIVLREVAEVLPRISEEASRRFCTELGRAKRIYITGVGRSGLVVHAFGQRLMHLGFDVHLAHEITAPAIARGDLLVACSGTGTTLLPLYMARKARRIGARVVAITARPRSPLARRTRPSASTATKSCPPCPRSRGLPEGRVTSRSSSR
jgi:6-phospho-3-hexuloisomerase